MLNDDSLKFLHRLLDTPGPSGFESAPGEDPQVLVAQRIRFIGRRAVS